MCDNNKNCEREIYVWNGQLQIIDRELGELTMHRRFSWIWCHSFSLISPALFLLLSSSPICLANEIHSNLNTCDFKHSLKVYSGFSTKVCESTKKNYQHCSVAIKLQEREEFKICPILENPNQMIPREWRLYCIWTLFKAHASCWTCLIFVYIEIKNVI